MTEEFHVALLPPKVDAQIVAVPVAVAGQVHEDPYPHASSLEHTHAPVTRG